MAAVQVEVPRLPGPPGQPDIDYAPDLEKYKRRTQRRLQTEELPRTLPPGFPEKLDSPLAWDGATVGDHYQWNYELTPSDIEEIEQALRHFQCSTTRSATSRARSTPATASRSSAASPSTPTPARRTSSSTPASPPTWAPSAPGRTSGRAPTTAPRRTWSWPTSGT
ncbi:hypothetical protein VTK73DRAFT_431 [Phialemonium thermophilum]|uniref:Uncharacterized protein n=1 Tax=Phialemonium thermophilum TaxID=223376 RepID=A0ABR3VV69_9PEZI